ncbi:MAG: SGNH/GDSL hydrolase family protein [Ruminococcus sp.]|nr:SGNH/GDSL hydrolase family protein [Ruminococcus sp.]
MKDYGNAGAICGALGCMVLLIISMYLSKNEEPEVKSTSAEISRQDKETAVTTAATAVSGETGTQPPEETSGENTVTTTTAVFIGPLSKEAMATSTTTVNIDPELIRENYPEEISIVGDSIASGFGAYQVLLNPFNFSASSLASWSIMDYTFTYDGNTLNYIDALKEAQPGYIYMSFGMNDLNAGTSDEFAENYRTILAEVQEACPESCIIVAGISPVSGTCTFAANSTIVMFNEKLKSVVDEVRSDRICYYDTASLLSDAESGVLLSEYDGGDGIHLSYAAYEKLLENLYPILDEMPVPAMVVSDLSGSSSSETETETVTETGTDAETEGGETAADE